MRALILDAGPLITLAQFSLDGVSLVEHVRAYAPIEIVTTVEAETTANLNYRDAVEIQRLIAARRIDVFPRPVTPFDRALDLYTRLGSGERDTFRLALTREQATVVVDDYLAFVIGHRFGLRLTLLLDLWVALVRAGRLSSERAVQFVTVTGSRYSAPFVEHTLQLIAEAGRDSNPDR
jgi:predicted nucleic acid-binding protein